MSHLLFCSEPFPRKHLSSFSLEIIQNKIKIYYKAEIKDFERIWDAAQTPVGSTLNCIQCFEI